MLTEVDGTSKKINSCCSMVKNCSVILILLGSMSGAFAAAEIGFRSVWRNSILILVCTFFCSVLFMIVCIAGLRVLPECVSLFDQIDEGFAELSTTKGKIVTFLTRPFGSRKLINRAEYIAGSAKVLISKAHAQCIAAGLVSVFCMTDAVWTLICIIKK